MLIIILSNNIEVVVVFVFVGIDVIDIYNNNNKLRISL